jgi:hypothetical protein
MDSGVEEVPILRKHGRLWNTKEQIEYGGSMPPWRIQMECRRESQVPRDIPKCAKFKP